MNSPRSSSRIRSGVSGQQGDTAKELEAAWSDLGDADASRGQRAVRTLLAAPDLAMVLLRRAETAGSAGGPPVAGLGQDADEPAAGHRGCAGGWPGVAAAPGIPRRFPGGGGEAPGRRRRRGHLPGDGTGTRSGCAADSDCRPASQAASGQVAAADRGTGQPPPSGEACIT
jgi:hypothetical protein